MNLLMVTGEAYGTAGALILMVRCAAWTGAAGPITPCYPRVLAKRRTARTDARFGLWALTCGGILCTLAAYGYAAPLSLWRYPACVAVAALIAYGVAKFLALRPVYRGEVQRPAPRSPHKGMYETRRSIRLREAALREAAGHIAREVAAGPRDAGVIYLTKHWERRWWSDKLGVSTGTLEAAVRRVGPMVKDIERHLQHDRKARDTLAA